MVRRKESRLRDESSEHRMKYILLAWIFYEGTDVPIRRGRGPCVGDVPLSQPFEKSTNHRLPISKHPLLTPHKHKLPR